MARGSRSMPKSLLTGLSGNDIGINSIPEGNVSVTLTVVVTSPAGEAILTASPSLYPRCLASLSLISTQAWGENFFSREALELLVPLPKWCSIVPDNSISGYPSPEEYILLRKNVRIRSGTVLYKGTLLLNGHSPNQPTQGLLFQSRYRLGAGIGELTPQSHP